MKTAMLGLLLTQKNQQLMTSYWIKKESYQTSHLSFHSFHSFYQSYIIYKYRLNNKYNHNIEISINHKKCHGSSRIIIFFITTIDSTIKEFLTFFINTIITCYNTPIITLVSHPQIFYSNHAFI